MHFVLVDAAYHGAWCRESSPYSRRAANELLRVEPVEMPGGHSPFLSRPSDVAKVLEHAVSTSVETAHG